MTTYNTGNPVGSTDVRDLYDNAQNLDSLVNGPLTSYADRLGAPRKSWRGLEQDFSALLAASGFELPALEYVGGTPLVVDRPTQLIFRTGFPDTLYGVKSTEPFPATLSGTWSTDEVRLVVRSDGDLRQDLANSTDPAKGAGLVGYAGGTVSGVLATIATQLANAVYVVGDGTDQSAELSAALNSGNAVILKGDILLGSPVVSLAAFNVVTSEGASITYTGSVGSSGVLQFRPSVGLVVVGQLSIDCDNRAGYGLSCRPPSDGVRLVKIDGVSVSNCFAAAPSNSGAYGILVGVNGPGQIKFIAITNCEVIGVSRSLGDGVGGTCAGIAATDGITTVIVGNKISGISLGNGSVNADGIVVFSELVGSSYLPSNSLIQSNTITDCAGRMVKLQTRGKAVVEDNLMEVSNIALIPSWRGIDSQVADADIRHNKLTFTGAWSGGVDLSVFQVVPLVADFTGQASNSKIHDNIVNVRATATRIASGRVFMAAFTFLATNAATATADIYNNQVTFEGGLNSDTPACKIAFSVYVPDVWAPGATAAVKIRNNQVSAMAFMESLGGGGTLNTDITGKLALLQISNNTLLSANSIPVFPWSSGDRYTSDLLVYGNAVGRRGGEVVAPFDFSRIKPGCEFVIAGGASSGYTNNPSSYTYSEVRHSGAFIQVDRGSTLYKSLFAPAPGATLTWTVYQL